jgi:hypothetical protein
MAGHRASTLAASGAPRALQLRQHADRNCPAGADDVASGLVPAGKSNDLSSSYLV